jgi:hypothetical protein
MSATFKREIQFKLLVSECQSCSVDNVMPDSTQSVRLSCDIKLIITDFLDAKLSVSCSQGLRNCLMTFLELFDMRRIMKIIICDTYT